MILMQREGQSEREYVEYLDGLIQKLQALQKSPGWELLRGQLEQERQGAFDRMAGAPNGDSALKAATEYTVLTRVLEAPGRVLEVASKTLAARPQK